MKTKIKNKKINFFKIAKVMLLVIFCLITIMAIFISGYLLNKSKTLTFDENTLKQINSQLNLYDIDNKPFTSSNNQKKLAKLDDLPSFVPGAFISIEDKNFYNHKGLNYKRILKAVINNLKSGSFSEGASTISQQLIKNTHLSNEKTIDRKVKEMLLTKKMENKLSKNEILETYLNAIYFGSGAYGIENASFVYFNKQAKDLTISESATLAGIIKSPKLYSPIYNKEKCIERRNIVLSEMKKDKLITEVEYQNAIDEKLTINEYTKQNKNFYEKAVIDEACKILNISEKDLAMKDYYIFTYLDSEMQNNLISNFNNDNYYEVNNNGKTADSCGIIIDNKTGGILAFSGKSDYDLVNMKRSPGSSIKPILVYAPALEDGLISPLTQILDKETSFDGYKPQNVGGKYYGYVSATESVEKSLNIPAIKIMQMTGIEKSKKMAENCGIIFDKTDSGYAIALGGMKYGTTVKELVNSYLPFSNDGNFIEAKFIRKICDKNGNKIYENKMDKTKVMSEETAYLMNEMLISGVKKGTSSRLNVLDYEVAGKTGTVGIKNTNYNSDVWSVAYTTDYTVGMWLGNSTGKEEYRLEGSNNGGTYCTSLVRDTFKGIYKNKEKPKDFSIPNGIETLRIDSQALENEHTLEIADENTPEMFTIKANFNKKYAPKKVANVFSELKAVELSVKLENSKPKLTFKASPQVEYKVYRINDDEVKVVKTLKNKKGEVEIIDDEVESDNFYTYYVEAFAINHATNAVGKRVRSNSVKIFTPTNENLSSSIQNKSNNSLFSKIRKKFF